MNFYQKLILAVIFLFAACGIYYYIYDTATPFIVAFILAYLLQPLIRICKNRLKLPNMASILLILAIFSSVITAALVGISPLVFNQISQFSRKIPLYKKYFEQKLLPNISEILNKLHPNIVENIQSSFNNIANELFSSTLFLFNNVWNYTISTINVIMLILLVPVLMFYFMRDWQQIFIASEKLIPPRFIENTRKIFSEIDQLLSAYLRGQLNLCLILSGYYSLGLTLANIDFSILIGIISGFLVILPFIGPFIAVSLAVTFTYLSFGIDQHLAFVAIIYLSGQALESSFLTPKIIGKQIGLHPLWIIFAVLLAGKLFGFIGIIIAVPSAGIIKILLKHCLNIYYDSKLYKQ